MKFETILDKQVDMAMVDLEALKPWISCRITDVLNHEDEVVIDYVYNQLEPRYPDPKEIQANLSGFFSMKNARLFLADLWKKLLDSTLLVRDRNSGKITKRLDDKVKSLPKLLSPEDHKVLTSNNSKRQHSEHREEERRYRHRSYSSYSDYSRSESHHRNYRDRRQSRNRYESSPRYRDRRRSRSRSSTGHTPYTRYSDYTDDRSRIAMSSLSESSSGTTSESSSSASFSSSSSSVASSVIARPLVSRGSIYDDRSDSSSTIIDVPESRVDATKNHDQKSPDTLSPKRNDCEVEEKSTESTEMTLCDQDYFDVIGKSRSRSYVESTCVEINDRSPHISSSSYSSTSSEYSIEYVEKTQLIEYEERSEDSDDSDSLSYVEWVTAEQYDRMLHDSIGPASVCSSTLTEASSDSSSYFSETDVIWLDECQLQAQGDLVSLL